MDKVSFSVTLTNTKRVIDCIAEGRFIVEGDGFNEPREIGWEEYEIITSLWRDTGREVKPGCILDKIYDLSLEGGMGYPDGDDY